MLEHYVENLGLPGQVNGIVLDLGVSSPQLDDAQRGFSFRREGPLDMRMDPDSAVSAAQWINEVTESTLTLVLRSGEERFARRIARAIIAARPLHTTTELARIVAQAVPTREPGKDPATRTFQAIRMHINQELSELEAVLPQTLRALTSGGRLTVISFHSLEDRVVKQFMRREEKGDPYPSDLPIQAKMLTPHLRTIGKAVRPTDAEVEQNPRARSAILRIAERVVSGYA